MSAPTPSAPHRPTRIEGPSRRRFVDACERNGGVLLVVAAGTLVTLVAGTARLLLAAS